MLDLSNRKSSEQFLTSRRILICRLVVVLLLFSGGFLSRRVHAQPSVESIYPAAGQRGQAFALMAVGAGFDDSSRVVLYDARVRCESTEVISANELKLNLQTPEDCTPGTCAFRISTTAGLSELHVFCLSPFSILEEVDSNDTLETAQRVAGNQTIVGRIDAGDADCFRVAMKRGQRISAEVQAIRAGGELFDAVLNVYDPNGNWVMSVDDTAAARQDPIVSFEAASDGDYIFQLHEVSFQGGESARYALHIGEFVRPSFVFPAGGQLGTTMNLTLGGIDITPNQQELSLTAASFEDGVIDRLSPGTGGVFIRHNGVINPVAIPFRFSPLPNVLEPSTSEPNGETLKELHDSAIDLPVALNGILHSPGDVDEFRIHGRSSGLYEVEVFADRLGSPLDSILTVLNSSGQIIARSDDGLTHDSRLTVLFPETADYVVRIEDKRGNGTPGHFYRIEVTEKRPELTAFLSRPDRLSQARQTIAVPQGNRVLTFLACQRRGFEGVVQFSASGLPQGMHMPMTTLDADRYWCPMIIEASRDAALISTLADIEVTGSGKSPTGASVDVSGRFRQVIDLVSESADQLFMAAEVNRLAVAVTEPIPFTVQLNQPKSSLAPDGTLELQIDVKREKNFRGPVEVSLPFLPPWIDGAESVLIPGDQDSGIFQVRALPQAVPRDWSICAEAHAVPGKPADDANASETTRSMTQSISVVNPVRVASNLVTLSIRPSPVTGQLQAAAVEQGVPIKIRCQLNLEGTLPEPLTAVLEGLPNRVTAREVRFSSDAIRNGSAEIEFDVIPEPTAPVGTFEELQVHIHGEMDGRHVSWCADRAGKITICRTGELFRDDSGRPLTRLQALRQQDRKPKEN